MNEFHEDKRVWQLIEINVIQFNDNHDEESGSSCDDKHLDGNFGDQCQHLGFAMAIHPTETPPKVAWGEPSAGSGRVNGEPALRISSSVQRQLPEQPFQRTSSTVPVTLSLSYQMMNP